VSSNTDILLLGENPGSKYDKAKSLGVKIIEEEELNEYLNTTE
jgi:DNA ligase (NAD+)